MGRLPRGARRLVNLVFWPTRASSCHQSFTLILAGSLARISSNSPQKFFKILAGELILSTVTWPCQYLSEPQRPQLTAHGRLIERDAKPLEYPKRQVLAAPAHDTVGRRDRPTLDNPGTRPALGVIEFARLARRLAVNQASRPLGIETQYPVSNHLETNITEPHRIRTLRVVVNLGQRRKPTALARILRRLGQSSQTRPIKIFPQRDFPTNGEPPNPLTTLIKAFDYLGTP